MQILTLKPKIFTNFHSFQSINWNFDLKTQYHNITLGTGRNKPYVDKKDFFQDLKKPPPKRLLKQVINLF